MRSHHSSNAPRRVAVCLMGVALLLSGLLTGGMPAASAQELPPPTPWPEKIIPPELQPLMGGVSIAAGDIYEPDNTATDAKTIDPGVPQNHSISPVDPITPANSDVDWVTFTLAATSSITLETSGTAVYDTYLTLYSGTPATLTQIDQNDDKDPNTLYSFIQRCGTYALPAGTYYLKIEERGDDEEIPSYDIAFNINLGCLSNTTVFASGTSKGSFYIRPQDGKVQTYPGLKTQRVEVTTRDGVTPETPLIAALGIKLKSSAGYASYTEFLGQPAARIKTKYYFPQYANAGTGPFVSQLLFANVGNATTKVTVKIGATVRGTYTLARGQAKTVSYAGLKAGPVVISSSGGVPIIASMNVKLKKTSVYSSYSEYTGISTSSSSHLSTAYVFPWYSNSTTTAMASQLRIANIGTASTHVAVTIGRVLQGTYLLSAGQFKALSYASLNGGPVVVQSLDNIPIMASLGINYKGGTAFASYAESPGLPAGTPSAAKFVFPWYSNAATGPLKSQLRVVNMGGSATVVKVMIAGIQKGSFSLGSHQSKVVSFAGVNSGPVVVTDSNSMPLLVSMGVYLKKGSSFDSYTEFIGQAGLPGDELSWSSWFPMYDSSPAGQFNSQLRIGIP